MKRKLFNNFFPDQKNAPGHIRTFRNIGFTSCFARTFTLVVSLFLFSARAQAQCTTTTAGPYIIPGTVWQTLALNDVQYMTFDALASCQYTFSFCQNGGSYMFGDPFLTITDMSDNPITWSDDWCGLGSEITWTCPASGMYKIHNTNFGCGPGPDTRVLAYWSSCDPTPCSGVPTAGTANAAASTIACEGSTTLGLTGNTLASDLVYQWEYSTDGINWFNLGSSQTTFAISTGTITQTTQYRCIVTCTNSSQSATSQPVTVTVTGPIPGAAAATPPVTCAGGTSLISLVGSTTTGVNYQWQTSPNNVAFTNISGGTSSTYTTPPITAPIYYQAILTCTVNGLTSTATSVLVDTLTSAAPAVSPSTLTVTCGSPATFTATPVSGGTIAWFTQAIGGTSVATGATASFFPTTTTTYYAENNIPPGITSTTSNNFAIVDHDALTGDDRGGIAVSGAYVYITGDNNTARFLKSNLTGGVTLPRVDGIFADQGQTLYAFGDATGVGNDYYFNGGLIDRIYMLDADLNTIGSPIMLSVPFNIPAFDGSSFIAPGDNYVIFNLAGTFYRISLANGNVTTISTTPFTDFTWSESFASRGWAEFDGTDYYVYYAYFDNASIYKFNVSTGAQTVIGSYIYLSDMASIAFDVTAGRMYFHYEGFSSDFGGNSETLGYTEAIISTSNCGSNGRTPVTVTVTPMAPPTINPSGTVNICTTGSQTFTASPGASYQWYLNGNIIAGATNQTYSTSTAGNYTVQVTTGLGCAGTSAATTLNVNTGVPASVNVTPSPNDTICIGTIVTFTAAPTNGGTNPSYQWKKNGVNVGLNSPVYTGAGLLDGDQIEVVMTVGTNICTTTPTATSSTITMSVSANTVPAVSIAAVPGTTACADDPVTFTATPTNGGTNPAYQWTVNGSNVGTNSATYTAPAGSLSSTDVVSVTMTPSLLCSSPTSAGAMVTMTITPLTAPTVSVAASATDICEGTPVTFTATDNAPGGSYQWLVNGNPSGPNNSVYTYIPVNGDVVSLDFTPPTAGCFDNITVTSNSTTINVTPGLPTSATVSSTASIGQGMLVTVYANLFNFNTNYTIDWYINSVLYTTTTVPYMSYVKGPGTDDIYAIVNNSGSGCYLSSTTNNITIDTWATSVAIRPVTSNIEVYPNPFNNQLVIKGLSDGDRVILFNLLGQTLQEWSLEKVDLEQHLNVIDLATGSYLLNVRDKDGNFKEMRKIQKM